MNGKRQPCLIFSRVVGWLTPTSNWNLGKQEEYKQRKEYETKS